jgi:Bacterial extracellular solute-binding proteins, family 5 Middle
VKVFERFAAFGLIVCLQAISACSTRQAAVVVPVPPANRPPEPPAAVLPTPDPPPAATTVPASIDTADCSLIAAAGEPIATVGLSDRVDPAHAPRPANDSERLLFRQLYETLVAVDCLGRVRPALAASWRLDTDGRTWIVTLRENARFADGTPVTADDVRASWSGDRNQLHPVDSLVTISDQVVAITFRPQRADVDPLQVLAHPDLAIAKPVADSAWPVGTRSARIATQGGPQREPRAPAITIARDGKPPLRFFVAPGDARDLLDGDVDLLLTRDPTALDYARTLPQFQTMPLTWQRTHVLLTPDRSRPSAPLSAQARQVLADDAVRGEARGALEPFWWQMVPGCDVLSSPPRGKTSPAPRIVYSATDAAARDLAERFVGLVRASGPAATMFLDVLLPDRPRRTYERALGLTGNALAQAIRLGADAGYVVSVDSRPVDPCRDLQALIGIAPWLDPETIIPLVDTRLQAVVRRGRSGVSAEWDGGLVLAGVSELRPR